MQPPICLVIGMANQPAVKMMQLYFFDQLDREGRRIPDVDGQLCRDLDHAKVEAARILAEARQDDPPSQLIEVRDRREGQPLWVLDDTANSAGQQRN